MVGRRVSFALGALYGSLGKCTPTNLKQSSLLDLGLFLGRCVDLDSYTCQNHRSRFRGKGVFLAGANGNFRAKAKALGGYPVKPLGKYLAPLLSTGCVMLFLS